MVDPYRASRQFERKIFRGVPEHPETTSERDRNANVPERLTGSSQHTDSTIPEVQNDWSLIGMIYYDQHSDDVGSSMNAGVDASAEGSERAASRAAAQIDNDGR